MEPSLWLLVLLALGSLVGNNWNNTVAAWRRHQQRRGWQKAIALCGLDVGETRSLPLRAQVGPLEVRINTAGSEGQHTLVIVVVPGPPDFKKVRIRPETPDPSRWVPEIQTGDEDFDRKLFIEGPAPLVLALLDARMRELLLRVSSESRLEIVLGELRAVISHQRLAAFLPRLLEVGQRFAEPIDVLRRVAESAKRDPNARARLQNLLALAREVPEDPATVEVLRAACSDPSPEVRLQAGKELGAEGRDTLLKLAEGIVDDAVSSEAVSILARELPVERTMAILDRALATRRIQTSRVCLEMLGRSGAAAAIDRLAKVAEYEKIELAVVAVQALEAIGSPAEPPLIRALQREQKEVKMAAAYALGRVGSVAAVLPLKEVAEHSSRGLEILHAARLAIAEIQSRLPGASPGQLSLAGTEAGQLSLAQEETGQLSLADTGGQLSFPSAEPGQPSLDRDAAD